MKKLIILFSFIFLLSCSNKYDIITDYLENENLNNKIIHVNEFKNSEKYALLQLRGSGYKTQNGEYIYSNFKMISKDEFETLFEKFKSSDSTIIKWKTKDFNTKKIKLISKEYEIPIDVNDKLFENYKYQISDIILLKEDIGFFYIRKSRNNRTFYDKVILIQKIKNKWKILYEKDTEKIN